MRRNKKILIVSFILVVSILILGKNFFPFVFELLFNKDINLRTSGTRINVLLLGTSGQNHEGPNLTDTIIFSALDPSKKEVTLVSVPRDLWVPGLNQKVNTAYAIGENQKQGDGLILAKKTVSKILNQPVDYAVRFNFNGFTETVDLIGGIDVEVENTFDDYEYPIDGKEDDPCGHKQEELKKLATASSQLKEFPCRYMRVHFERGIQHLDGKSALEFVRSRHAQGPEGTDFARSARQEKVIKAFKDKVLAPQTLFNPIKLISLYAIFKNNIDTDIVRKEFDDFIRLAQRLQNSKVKSAVLDYGGDERSGLLIHPPITEQYNFQWALIPRTGNGNFLEIQKYVDCQIKTGDCDIFPHVKKNN